MTLPSVEHELVSINQRLDHITTLLNVGPYHSDLAGNPPTNLNRFNEDERSPFELLGTQIVMTILGLDTNFALRLRQLERATRSTAGPSVARLYMVTHQQALR